VRDASWLDAHFAAATGMQPDELDDLVLSEEVIVAAEINVDGATTAERRASRHSIETSPASSASSAA
jgi:hypothetical protein